MEARRLFGWDDELTTVTGDVGPKIRMLSNSGVACLALLGELVGGKITNGVEIRPPRDFDEDDNGLEHWLKHARRALTEANVDLGSRVSGALAAKKSGSANNSWETIRYSLLDRSESKSGDLYAVLRPIGKFTTVEPGQEWLVAVASLLSGSPGGSCRLSDLQAALGALGISASSRTLVERLEQYGIARSSHDADDALEISAGF